MFSVGNLLNAREAAEVLGESVSTVTRLANTGALKTHTKLPGLRGARLFHRSDVARLKVKRERSAA